MIVFPPTKALAIKKFIKRKLPLQVLKTGTVLILGFGNGIFLLVEVWG